MSYEPPITLFEDLANQIAEWKDNQIVAQVRMYVDVDKAELIKALNYDRQQYEKGYEDAKKIFEKKKRRVDICCKTLLQMPILPRTINRR